MKRLLNLCIILLVILQPIGSSILDCEDCLVETSGVSGNGHKDGYEASDCVNCCSLAEYDACCTPDIVSAKLFILTRDFSYRGQVEFLPPKIEKVIDQTQFFFHQEDTLADPVHWIHHAHPLII
ncbi:MAG: hypothetical protein H8E26_12625 [FCB group bacterium]|nr:hypothetical protein [FCB group bacterium]MBL7121147.1 hypothetical protein [Candidatus Neomarinimicrobiota bacterium]